MLFPPGLLKPLLRPLDVVMTVLFSVTAVLAGKLALVRTNDCDMVTSLAGCLTRTILLLFLREEVMFGSLALEVTCHRERSLEFFPLTVNFSPSHATLSQVTRKKVNISSKMFCSSKVHKEVIVICFNRQISKSTFNA